MYMYIYKNRSPELRDSLFDRCRQVVLFFVKLNPKFLSIRGSQSNLEMFLYFVNCEEKYY